jgi:hypothetical protein
MRGVCKHWPPSAQSLRLFCQEVPQMLRANSGVALTIQVQRENRIRNHRKPWNNGRLDAEGWNNQTSTRAYFTDFARFAQLAK